MLKKIALICLAWLPVASSCFAALPAFASIEPADLVLRGGVVYTIDSVRRWAQSVAVDHGKIVFVGRDNDIQKYIGAHTRVIDLNGKMVLPGFHDCHTHLAESGLELANCSLADAKSKEEVLNRIADYVEKQKKDTATDSQSRDQKDKWILGNGWSLPLFANANPLKQDLDAILPNRPGFFLSQDAHSAWVNSRALTLAGITKSTSDPPNGRIERGPDGEPSGTLRESAVKLMGRFLPEPTLDQRMAGLKMAESMANQFGITSIQDAHVTEPILKTYERAQEMGELTVKVVAALHTDPTQSDDQVDALKRLREKYTHGMLRATSAKIFADGVIEAHTAALVEPYSDQKDNFGILNFPPEKMKSLVARLDKEGFQVHVHAIGDRAINESLDAFQYALEANGRNDNRHQIAHLELMQRQDIARFRELGVVANFESYWAFSDPYIVKLTEPHLGHERSCRLYQIASLLHSGAVVSGGSDWSVTTLNPLDAIQVALTRKSLDAPESASAWIPAERATLPEMLAAYTIAGAYVNHEDTETGSIEIGKCADMIVLDHNLFEIQAEKIHQAKVLMTLLDGKIIYHSPDWKK